MGIELMPLVSDDEAVVVPLEAEELVLLDLEELVLVDLDELVVLVDLEELVLLVVAVAVVEPTITFPDMLNPCT